MSPGELALELELFINRGLSEGWSGWPLARCHIPINRPALTNQALPPLQAGNWGPKPAEVIGPVPTK